VILVNGYMDIDPDQRDAFIAAVQKLQAPTRAEDGCESYAISADVDDPARFHISEQWASEEAVAGHMAAPHMAEFFGAVGGMVRGASVVKWTGGVPEKLM
jgi:quinol monooxygenase YgiN